MNAEEFKNLVRDAAEAITSAKVLVGAQHNRGFSNLGKAHVIELGNLWRTLDQHRQAMEAAERKKANLEPGRWTRPQVQTSAYVGGPVLMDLGELNKRFNAIEERLGGIESKADETREAYVAHMTELHKELSVFSPVRPCHEKAQPVAGLALESRLNAIDERLRRLVVAQRFDDLNARRRLDAIEHRLGKSERPVILA